MTKNKAGLIRKAGLACGCSIAALAATPAQAQLVCLNSPLGVLECGTADPAGTVNLPGVLQPVTVQLPDTFATASSILVDSTGPIVLNGDIVATTLLDNQPALDLTSDANIFAHVTTLATDGNNSPAALLRAVDGVVLVADDTVTTVGDFSNGIDISAASVDVTLDGLSTAGIESDGVQIVALSGPATLNANLIETLGSGSTDAILRAAGDIGVNVGVLRSGGDQALGLDLQSDATACAVLGAGSCDVNAIVGSITTDGFGSIGALVVAAGDTDLAIDALQTNGDEAAGLDLSADPAACVALGVGSCDTAFTVNNSDHQRRAFAGRGRARGGRYRRQRRRAAHQWRRCYRPRPSERSDSLRDSRRRSVRNFVQRGPTDHLGRWRDRRASARGRSDDS